jgi:hypothetical protein
MRRLLLFLLGAAAAALTSTVAEAQSSFFETSDGQQYVVVVMNKAEGAEPSPITVTVAKATSPGSKQIVATTSVVPIVVGTKAHARVLLPEAFDPNAKYDVSVSSSGIKWLDALKVSQPLQGEFLPSTDTICSSGLTLILRGTQEAAGTDAYWEPIYDYLFPGAAPDTKIRSNSSPSGVVSAQVFVDGALKRLDLHAIATRSNPGGSALTKELVLCLDPLTKLPRSDYSVELSFSGQNVPSTLRGRFVQAKVTGLGNGQLVDASITPGNPGERPLERNLDLGFSFSSSYDKETETRTNRGVADIRLAPILNLQRKQLPPFDQKWFFFWTPVYLDANVATGPITKDTLALNRVEIGSEVEWRYLPFRKVTRTIGDRMFEDTDLSKPLNVYRLILRGKNASDRDFKQNEYLASFEFQPLFGVLTRPIDGMWTVRHNPITGEDVRVAGVFGWEIKPRVGFTIGRTYSRRDPAAAVLPGPTVKRLEWGVDAVVNLSPRAKLTVVEAMYLRGEAAEDRFENYFKSELNFPLGSPIPQTEHGLFVSYERGNKPPFATPDVDVFRIGYRIRSDGWFGIRR